VHEGLVQFHGGAPGGCVGGGIGPQLAAVLVEIRVPDNVRALDPEHVEALAGSIKLQGCSSPSSDNGNAGSEFVAGFHRIAAACSVGLAELPVVVRDVQTEDADRAVENITSRRHRREVELCRPVVMPMSELNCHGCL